MSTPNIFSLPSDVLREIALKGQLSVGEILNLCESHPTFNATVCQNEEFWLALGKIYLTENVSILNRINIKGEIYGFYTNPRGLGAYGLAEKVTKGGYEKALAAFFQTTSSKEYILNGAVLASEYGFYRVIDVYTKNGLNLDAKMKGTRYSIMNELLHIAVSNGKPELVRWFLSRNNIFANPNTYLQMIENVLPNNITGLKIVLDLGNPSIITTNSELVDRITFRELNHANLKVLLDAGFPSIKLRNLITAMSPIDIVSIMTMLDKFDIAPQSIHYSVTLLRILAYKYLSTLSIDQLCSLIANDYQNLLELVKPCNEYSIDDLLRGMKILLDQLTEPELTSLVAKGEFPALMEQVSDSAADILELIPNRISETTLANIYAQVESHGNEINLKVDEKLYKPLAGVAEKLKVGLGWRDMRVASFAVGTSLHHLGETDFNKMRVIMGLRDYTDIIVTKENDVKLLRIKAGSLLKLPPSWIINTVKANYGRVVVFSENPIFRPE